MLRDGEYIREAPPKIGIQYIPRPNAGSTSKEELFAQDIILMKEERRQSVLSKILGAVLRI